MKKFLTVLLTALMVFALVGCNKTDNSGNGGTTPEPTPADDGVTKIAVLLPFTGDQSYFDTLANAAREVDTADNNIKVDLFECDPNGSAEESKWMDSFAEVCEDGEYDLVVSGNDTYEGFLYKACEKYPDQMFYNFDYTSTPETGVPANCYCVDWALDDLGYVVGALSAAVTKTGTVGVVVGMDNQGMNQFISGYCQVLADKGVKYVIAYPESFTDTALGKEVTEDMIGKGADVIWQVAGGLGNGVIDACSGHDDVWCIGVDQDQYLQFKGNNDAWANTILTSALKNTNVAFKEVCNMVANGTYKEKLGKAESWGIAWNGVGLAENDYYLANASEEVRAQVAETLASVASGAVEVVDCKQWDEKTYETEWPKVRDAGRVQ
jgi:basic membrane protein A